MLASQRAAPYARSVSLEPRRQEPQVVYVERRGFACAPNCGCCMIGLLTLLFGCALFAWFAAVALGLH